jgi:uncharacterized protein Smg (DUF494 family)
MNEIDTYLAENRDRYTREALTNVLREAGHDPADIEAAWARLDAPVTRSSPLLETTVNPIDAYLAKNRDRYPREQLDDVLQKAGHDPAEIEAAWARLDAPGAMTWSEMKKVKGPPGRPGAGTYLLIVIAVLCYGAAIVAAGATIAYGGAVSILMLVYVIAMIAGLVYSVRRLLRAPTLGEGASAIGVAFAISIVIFVGLSGACFAALGPALNAGRGV